MQIDEPIFRSVQQALHFSFLMATLPVSQKSQMQEIYRQGGQRVWGEDKYEPSTIHFGGLNPLEVRGQCAMVRAAVQDHLLEPERFAIHARFGYQTEKAAGVRGIRDYCLPLLVCQTEWATLSMAWSIFASDIQKDGLSIREIAEHFSLKVSAVNDDIQRITKTARALESRAYDSLNQHFAGTGLVESS